MPDLYDVSSDKLFVSVRISLGISYIDLDGKFTRRFVMS